MKKREGRGKKGSNREERYERDREGGETSPSPELTFLATPLDDTGTNANARHCDALAAVQRASKH